MDKLFSVLIANYNNNNFLKDCIDSLLAQTYKNWEAIIVDDSSTDDSINTINVLVAGDSRFKLYKNNCNSGVGFTKKKCIDLSSGTICGFLDPDDAITPDAIELMIGFHQKHPEVSLIYSNFIYCDENLKPLQVRKTIQVDNGIDDFYNFSGPISHFATFKKELYLKTSGLDPFYKRAVDQDLYLKLYDIANVIYIDYDLYFYRIHSSGISTNSNVEKAYFWHWNIALDRSRIRNTNLEDTFLKKFTQQDNYVILQKQIERHINFRKKLQKSKWLKLGNLLGLFKHYNEL